MCLRVWVGVCLRVRVGVCLRVRVRVRVCFRVRVRVCLRVRVGVCLRVRVGVSPQFFLIRSLGMANPQLKTYFIVLLASKKNFKALILDLGWRIPIKAGISKVVVVFLILK